MRPGKNVEKVFSDLHDTTSADMDERVLGDALRALEKSQKTSAASQLNIWRRTTKTHIRALAAAAVVIIGVLIGVIMFLGSDEQLSSVATEGASEVVAVNKGNREKSFDAALGEFRRERKSGEPSAGLLMSFQAETKEVADGQCG